MLHRVKRLVHLPYTRSLTYGLATCQKNMASPKVQVTVDFDGTLTISDTLSALASISRASNASSLWKTVSDEYMQALQRHTSEPSHVLPSERKTLNAELAHLHSLKGVESNSFQKVKDSGLFSGVTLDDVQKGAHNALENGAVQLRPGWGELMQLVTKAMGPAAMMVLSVNFSIEWIRGVLLAGAEHEKNKDLRVYLSKTLQSMPIYANEVLAVSNSSSVRDEPLHTCDEKLDTFRSSTTTSRDWLKIYIGDSTTDLECLLAADVGICVRNVDEHGAEKQSSSQRELDDACKRVGISLDRLNLMMDSEIKNLLNRQVLENKLWWVHDLYEVLEWLKRLLYVPPEDWLKMRWDAYHGTK